MKSNKYFYFLVLFIFAIYSVPYWPLLSLNIDWQWPKENARVIYFASTLQALCSLVFTFLFGAITASGVLWLRNHCNERTMSFVEYVLLMPSLLPSLFVIISVLSIVKNYPFGFWGVVILHVISMMGFFGVLLVRLCDDRLGTHSIVARTLGANGFFFLRKMMPMIARDLFLLMSVFFFYFFTSISIPLIVGGLEWTSVEKIIFDQIVVHHNWSRALHYFLLQTVFLLPILIWTQSYTTRATTSQNKMGLGSSFVCAGIACIPPIIICCGMSLRLFSGIETLITYPEFLRTLPTVIVGTLLLGFLTGGAAAFFLMLWTFISLNSKALKVLRFVCIPSVSVVAFGFSLWSKGTVTAFFYTALALTIVFVPSLFRLGVYQNFTRLHLQMDSARQLGANSLFVFIKIILPQMAHTIFSLSGLAAIWAMSDFTISRLILEKDWSLGLWVQSLVQQYRWDIAVVGCWLLLFCGLIVFLFFWSVARVSRQKYM